MKTTILAIAAAAVAAATLAAPARAEIIYFDMTGYATGSCQAALPAFEGQIRKRPLALQNEGTAAAFVTCSPQTFTRLYDRVLGMNIELLNNGTAAVTISCTGVSPAAGGPLYVSKSYTVAAGGIGFFNFSYDTDGFINGSVSCQLPPGAGLSRIQLHSEALYGENPY